MKMLVCHPVVPVGSGWQIRPQLETGHRNTMHIYHDGTWTKEELSKLSSGVRLNRFGKWYAMCSGCRTVVCLNKRLLGSIHFCE